MSQLRRADTSPCYRKAASCLLLFAAVFATSCTAARPTSAAQSQFGVSTSDGVVAARVDGFATGITNQDLTRLVLAGVGTAYAVDCRMSSAISPDTTQMIWRVTNNGRKPTAIVSVDLIRNGTTVRSAVLDAAAPGANPDAVFVQQIATLARRVLPRPSADAEAIAIHC